MNWPLSIQRRNTIFCKFSVTSFLTLEIFFLEVGNSSCDNEFYHTFPYIAYILNVFHTRELHLVTFCLCTLEKSIHDIWKCTFSRYWHYFLILKNLRISFITHWFFRIVCTFQMPIVTILIRKVCITLVTINCLDLSSVTFIKSTFSTLGFTNLRMACRRCFLFAFVTKTGKKVQFQNKKKLVNTYEVFMYTNDGLMKS